MASREGQSRVMPATAKILEYDGTNGAVQR